MKILMVDDLEDNLFLLKEILEKSGYENPLSAKCVTEAMKILESPEAQEIDLILMDICMPEITGIEACQKIKQIEKIKDIPIIMITAQTDLESLENAFKAGAIDYLTKPIRKIELLARVHSAISLKQAVDQRKAREQQLEVRNAELEKAMSEIKTLQGFLPICSYCKNIRDSKGYWQQLEAYMSQRSGLLFSHSICEPCMKTNFPDFVKKSA